MFTIFLLLTTTLIISSEVDSMDALDLKILVQDSQAFADGMSSSILKLLYVSIAVVIVLFIIAFIAHWIEERRGLYRNMSTFEDNQKED